MNIHLGSMNHKLVEGHFCNMISSSTMVRFTCMPTSIYVHVTITQVIHPSRVINGCSYAIAQCSVMCTSKRLNNEGTWMLRLSMLQLIQNGCLSIMACWVDMTGMA
jgi:hypothetical protein